MQRIRSIRSGVSQVIKVVAYILLVGSTVLAFEEVISRYVFGVSHMWAQEFTVFVIIYAVCLFMAVAHEWAEHINVTLLLDFMPESWRKIWGLILNLLTLIVCGVFAKASLDAMLIAFTIGVRSESILYPLWVLVLPLPIGFSLYAIYCLIGILEVGLSFSSGHLTAPRKDGL